MNKDKELKTNTDIARKISDHAIKRIKSGHKITYGKKGWVWYTPFNK